MITFLDIQKIFMLFVIYSICGWIIEVLVELMQHKRFVNRGFLLGPVCPVYGAGAVLITLILTKYQDDIVVVYCIAAILCGILEYMTSYVMEKLFNARWWDYYNFKLNINGRVCLEVITLFGFAGVAIINFFNPIFYKFLINPIPQNVLSILFYVLLTVFVIDLIVSLNVTAKIRKISQDVSKELKDNTEEISKKVREMLREKSMPYRRLLSAFPQVFADRVKSSKEKIAQAALEIKSNVIEVKEKTTDKMNDIKEKASSDIDLRKKKIKVKLKGFKIVLIKKVKDIRNEK